MNDDTYYVKIDNKDEKSVLAILKNTYSSSYRNKGYSKKADSLDHAINLFCEKENVVNVLILCMNQPKDFNNYREKINENDLKDYVKNIVDNNNTYFEILKVKDKEEADNIMLDFESHGGFLSHVKMSDLVKSPEENNAFEKAYENNAFEKAYENIVSSEEFRRLQDKTQVFPLAKSDYVRTRLTHSIEVSIIGKQLVSRIYGHSVQDKDPKSIFRNMLLKSDVENIVTCAGLLHDLGNPPFGHFGEDTIGEWFKNKSNREKLVSEIEKYLEYLNNKKVDGAEDGAEEVLRNEVLRNYENGNKDELNGLKWMNDLEKFEGNAQGLRILLKNYYKPEGATQNHLNVPCSIASAMVKYPNLSTAAIGSDKEVYRHKMGINYSEKEAFEKLSKVVWKDSDIAMGSINRNPLAYIVEAADDIAYLVSDIQDAIRTKIITIEKLREELERIANNREIPGLKELDYGDVEEWGNLTRDAIMDSVVEVFVGNIDKLYKGVFEKSLFEESSLSWLEEATKNLKVKYVYEHDMLVKPEIAAVTMVNCLMNTFISVAAKFAVGFEGFEKADQTDLMGKIFKTEAFKGLSDVEKKYFELIPENFVKDYTDWYDWTEAKSQVAFDEKLYHGILIATDFISGMTDRQAKDIYHVIMPNY